MNLIDVVYRVTVKALLADFMQVMYDSMGNSKSQ